MKRNIVATLHVALLGAAGGALGGVLLAAIGVLTEFGRPGSYLAYGLTFDIAALIASCCGAIAGAVLGPLYAWTLLRRAPLWRVIGETAFAAALGAGFVLVVVHEETWLPLGAAVSSLLAALRLHHVMRTVPPHHATLSIADVESNDDAIGALAVGVETR